MTRGARAALAGVGLLVLAGVLAGALLAVGALTGTSEAGDGDGTGVGKATRISYGYLAVGSAGIRPATAGLPGGPRADQVVVKAAVTLANTTASVQRHAPGQFRLRVAGPEGRGTWLRPVHATVPAGAVQPDAAVESSLTFLAPRGTAPVELTFADPGADAPVAVQIDPRPRYTTGA
jgi:hypothetical protein